MALILIKRGRYYTGTSSCTGFKDKHSWSANASEARRFADTSFSQAWWLAKNTSAKLVGVQNTKAEQKDKGRYMLKYPTERNRIYNFPEDTKPYDPLINHLLT